MEHRQAPVIRWGVAVRAHPGQDVCGDRHVVLEVPGGVRIAVLDGLGHGSQAAEASAAAARIIEDARDEPLSEILARCHDGLPGTRGVVMSLVEFNTGAGTMTWLGVGNVLGMLVRVQPSGAPAYEHLLLRGGVVGSRLPLVRSSTLPVSPGDTLILATDGVRPAFSLDSTLERAPQQVADHLLETHATGDDDALVLVARYVGESSDDPR